MCAEGHGDGLEMMTTFHLQSSWYLLHIFVLIVPLTDEVFRGGAFSTLHDGASRVQYLQGIVLVQPIDHRTFKTDRTGFSAGE